MANYLNPNSEISLSQAQSIFGNGPLVGYMAGQNRANQQTQMAANNLMENLNAIKAATGLPGAVEQNKLNQIMAQQKIQEAPLQGQVNEAGLQNQLTQFKTAAAQKGLGFAASVYPQIAQTVQQYGINSPQAQAAWQAMSTQYQQVTGQPIPPQFAAPNAKGLLALQTAHSYMANNVAQQQKMALANLNNQAAMERQKVSSGATVQAANIRAKASQDVANINAKATTSKFNVGEMATMGLAHQLAQSNPALYSDGKGNPNQLALQQAAAQLFQYNLHPTATNKAQANAAAQEASAANKLKGIAEGVKNFSQAAPQNPVQGTPLPNQPTADAGYRIGAIYHTPNGDLKYLGGNHKLSSSWQRVQ